MNTVSASRPRSTCKNASRLANLQVTPTKAERLSAFQTWEIAMARELACEANGEFRMLLCRPTPGRGTLLFSVLVDDREVLFPARLRRRYFAAEQWVETGVGRCPFRLP